MSPAAQAPQYKGPKKTTKAAAKPKFTTANKGTAGKKAASGKQGNKTTAAASKGASEIALDDADLPSPTKSVGPQTAAHPTRTRLPSLLASQGAS
jgi:hypothetical protein